MAKKKKRCTQNCIGRGGVEFLFEKHVTLSEVEPSLTCVGTSRLWALSNRRWHGGVTAVCSLPLQKPLRPSLWPTRLKCLGFTSTLRPDITLRQLETCGLTCWSCSLRRVKSPAEDCGHRTGDKGHWRQVLLRVLIASVLLVPF